MSESQDEAMVRSVERECDQWGVGMIMHIPLDRVRWLLAYGERLRAENVRLESGWANAEQTAAEKCCEDVKARLRAENEKLIQSDVALMQQLLREQMAHKATIRDYDEQLFQLRATALTASEAEYLRRYFGFKRRDESICSVNYDAMFAKLDRIAHPEPQEGK